MFSTSFQSLAVCLVLLLCPFVAFSMLCPGQYDGTPPRDFTPVPSLEQYNRDLQRLDIKEVIDEIRVLLHDSQECWPADAFNGEQTYGPLFIRLAWHCSGSYRDTDGAGGCGGGRQRFEPERSWEDNTNLDKARALLAPIKDKFGDGLSWGDLLVFAGTAAIIDMGGPIDKICAGRVDDPDGTKSRPLGPGPEAPDCPVQGNCQRPLGTSTIGLIYVNPEGFMGVPEPEKSAFQVREVFARMDFDDRETVALIGGGHAFGKSHGACPAGAGLPPKDAPYNPWPGLCGTGKGKDTFTSGIEGPWTSHPTKWDNEYFQLLLTKKYELHKGPGDMWQWKIEGDNTGRMMMTTDISLLHDEELKKLVVEFASDLDALNVAFAGAWYKLTHSGGEWAANMKCIDVHSY